MRITSLILLLFLLAAFTVGVSLKDGDMSLVDSALNNASDVIMNISIVPEQVTETQIPNMEGFYKVIEYYLKFISSLAFEVMRAGIMFGHDNPDYFEPEFILQIAKLIIILAIVSLLIKPVFYILIFLVFVITWFWDKYKKRKERKNDILHKLSRD